MDNLNGNSELNLKQLNDLKKIKKSIDAEVNSTVKVIKEKKSKQFKESFDTLLNYKKYNRKIMFIWLLMVATLPFVYIITHKQLTTSENMLVEHVGTTINISMNEDSTLNYDINSLSIKMKDKYLNIDNLSWLSNNLDTESNTYKIDNEEYSISKELTLNSFQITENMCYLQYANEESTGSKELIFAETKPSNIEISKVSSRFYEQSNPIQIKSYLNSYDKSFIMLRETLAGGSLTISTLRNQLGLIENSVTYSAQSDDDNSIVLNFDELGELKLSTLEEVKESPEVVCGKDGIIRIRNKSENIDYIYISCINNETIGCNAEDLLATNTDKLYIHDDFDKEGYVGYKTFALKTKSNLYVIKLNGLAHESLQTAVFEQLGIDTKQIEVKKIQRVIGVK